MTLFRPMPAADVLPTLARAALASPEIAARIAKRIDLDERKNYRDMDFFGIVRGDTLIGGIVFENASEMHIAVLPEYRGRWLTRGFYRFLGDQHRARGHLIGRVHLSAPRAEAFVRRFASTERREGNFTVFEITPPFGRAP